MAEVLVEFNHVITAEDGTRYAARAVGAEADNGNWHGWLEFTDLKTGQTIRSGRETTQPNRTDTVYWATGLTPVYLEGAPDRIEDPPTVESILNPFSVYRKGEVLLRRQLAALSVWHLVNIVRAYGLSDLTSSALNAMSAQDLIGLIVTAVRVRAESPLAR